MATRSPVPGWVYLFFDPDDGTTKIGCSTGPGGRYATHEGVLEIAGFRFRAYRLSDGRRVFDAGDVERFFLGEGGE